MYENKKHYLRAIRFIRRHISFITLICFFGLLIIINVLTLLWTVKTFDNETNEISEGIQVFTEIQSKTTSLVRSTERVKTTINRTTEKEYIGVEYIEFRRTDISNTGDLQCNDFVHQNNCMFKVGKLNEAKQICDTFLDSCRGFVWMSIVNTGGSFSVYMKNSVKDIETNDFSTFYIKRKFIKYITWKKREIKKDVI